MTEIRYNVYKTSIVFNENMFIQENSIFKTIQ
jgi:hypothetical protein